MSDSMIDQMIETGGPEALGLPADTLTALQATVAYCAERLERMESPVLYGGAPMVDAQDVRWVARKLRAALVEATR